MSRLFLIERQILNVARRKENREDFARELARYGKAKGDGASFRQIGTWLLIGMTGHWHRCMAFWEMQDGWDTFSHMIGQTMQAPEPALADLYRNVQNMRIGGETFILQGAGSTPSFEEMIRPAPGQNLLVYEEATVAPGAEQDYLAALAEERVPFRAQHGARFLGSFFIPKWEGRVISLWLSGVDGHAAMAKSDDSAWRARARQWRKEWREELWIAGPDSRFA
jgi:hypothetical protein